MDATDWCRKKTQSFKMEPSNDAIRECVRELFEVIVKDVEYEDVIDTLIANRFDHSSASQLSL
jgi:hypothetical protein